MKLSEAMGWFYLSMDCVKSPATVRFYKVRLPSLVEFLGDIDLDSVTIDMLRAWRSHLANRSKRLGHGHRQPQRDNSANNGYKGRTGKLSLYTLDQYIRCARRFFRWCHLEGRADANPAVRLERPSLPQQRRRGISKTDVTAMLKVTKKENNIRDHAIIRLLADSACRVGGIAGLTLSDLDLPNRRAIVHEKGKGGNNKERVIFLMSPTVEALRAWLQVRPQTKNLQVFVGELGKHKGKPITENGIYQMLKRTANRSGVKTGFNPHNFRHGAIRGWLNNGMPLSKASQLAGHSSTRVTGDIYGTSNDDELQDAHDQYGWID